MSPTLTHNRTHQIQLATGLLALLGLLWAYGSTLTDIAHTWSTNPQYSHGYLVPLFAAYLLWMRRARLQSDRLQPSWWGLPILGLALGLRLTGAYYHYIFFDSVSFVPVVAGMVLTLGGWAAWRWSWPAVLFLFFMVPLPYSIATSLAGPLQTLATIVSTFTLQTLGFPALAEGNIIRINDATIGIVEACSGLRMLVVFFALSTGMALVIKAPLGDKLFLVASSVPIALIVNIFRITLTGALHEAVNSEIADVFFHDVAGYLMPPLALGLLWLEWITLNRLLIPATASVRSAPRVSQRSSRTTAPTARQRTETATEAPRSSRAARRLAQNRPSKEEAQTPKQEPTPPAAQVSTHGASA